jgi:allantoinase
MEPLIPPRRSNVGRPRSVDFRRITEGIFYVCDWANDEQPYPMKTSEGELLALPIMLELDDAAALANRRVTADRYGEMLKEGFEVMYRDGGQNGRLLALNLHPWLIGQPFHIVYLDDALGYMMGRQGVWPATCAEIADWYRYNPPVA